MSNNSNVTFSQQLNLPSRGKFPNVPSTITLRAMSLLDEKKRLASNGLQGLIQLVNRCVTSPENFDATNMCQFDMDYALVALRALSHGNNYRVSVTCPHCGNTHEETIDLASLKCTEVNDDFTPQFEITLPVKGDTLTVHITTYRELFEMEEEADRIRRKSPNYEGDPMDIISYLYRIDAVNGEKMPFVSLKMYVENLSAADSIYFDEVYADKLKDWGLDTLLSFKCPNCNNTFERFMPMNDEFFRPRYYTTQR